MISQTRAGLLTQHQMIPRHNDERRLCNDDKHPNAIATKQTDQSFDSPPIDPFTQFRATRLDAAQPDATTSEADSEQPDETMKDRRNAERAGWPSYVTTNGPDEKTR